MGRFLLSSTSLSRWMPGLDFSSITRGLQPSSMFRWPELGFSGWAVPGWAMASLYWPLDLGLSVVDSVFWSLVTVLESIVLASMLCFFFVFCGCTL